jgi:hypothetical protein
MRRWNRLGSRLEGIQFPVATPQSEHWSRLVVAFHGYQKAHDDVA